MAVAQFLQSIGLEQFCQAFADNNVDDMETLKGMTKADLKDVANIGAAVKIMLKLRTYQDNTVQSGEVFDEAKFKTYKDNTVQSGEVLDEAQNFCESAALEDTPSEDSTYCAFSQDRSNSSIAGTADNEDEADYGPSDKDFSIITEDAFPAPIFAAFYNEFLSTEETWCNEIATSPSSRTRRQPPRDPSKPVAQLAFLADVIKSFQQLEFQIELQRLLLEMKAWRCARTGNESALRKIVLRRTDLELAMYREIMHKHGFTQHRETVSDKILMWKFIAPFLDDADVLKCLSEVDELLALPINSAIDEVSSWRRATQRCSRLLG